MLERRSDTELEQLVMRELKWDSRINWESINVDVKNGVVTLTGAVAYLFTEVTSTKRRS